MWRNRNSCICGRNVNGAVAIENSIIVPQEIKELLYGPAILLLGIYPKELEVGTPADPCTPMLTAALCTRADRQQGPKCPPMGEGLNTVWPILTAECYSAMKRTFNYHYPHLMTSDLENSIKWTEKELEAMSQDPKLSRKPKKLHKGVKNPYSSMQQKTKCLKSFL